MEDDKFFMHCWPMLWKGSIIVLAHDSKFPGATRWSGGVDFDGTSISFVDGMMEAEYQEGAVDAIFGGEQDIPRKPCAIFWADAWRVREEGALAGEYVVHTQVREVVAEVAALEEDEATAGGQGNVLGEEIAREARHKRGYMITQKVRHLRGDRVDQREWRRRIIHAIVGVEIGEDARGHNSSSLGELTNEEGAEHVAA
jgi:hypothetical protein